MIKYRVFTVLFASLAMLALLVKDVELLFCAFLVITNIYTVGGWLSDEMKAAKNEP